MNKEKSSNDQPDQLFELDENFKTQLRKNVHSRRKIMLLERMDQVIADKTEEDLKALIEEISEKPFDLLKEIEDTINWLNTKKGILSLFTLILSAITLFHFIMGTGVSLSIASPSIITALPLTFSLIVLLELLLIFPLFSMITIFFMPISDSGLALRHILNKKNATSLTEKERKAASEFMLTRWIGTAFSIEISSLIFIGIHVFFLPINSWWILITTPFLFAISIFLTSSIFYEPTIKHISKTIRTVKKIDGYRQYLIFAGCLQTIICLSITEFTYQKISYFALEEDGMQFILVALISLAVTISISTFQYLVIIYFNHLQKQPHPFRSAVKSVGILISILAVLPASSIFFASRVFQTTASGNRNCAQFTWEPNGASKIPELQRTTADGGKSRYLKIVLEADGIYQVKLLPDEKAVQNPKAAESTEIYFVPRSNVAAMSNCSKD